MSLTPQEIITAAIDCCDHIHTDGTGDQYVFRRGDVLEFAAELTKRATPAAASAGAAGTIDRYAFTIWDADGQPGAPRMAKVIMGDYVSYADHLADKAAAVVQKQAVIDLLNRQYCELETALAIEHDEVIKLRAATAPVSAAPQGRFKIGDTVRKTKGSQWSGEIVGTYSTSLTPEGYAVESSTERGSVQIYPAAALELVSAGAPVSAAEPDTDAILRRLEQDVPGITAKIDASAERMANALYPAPAAGQQLPTTYRLSVGWESARMEPDPAGEWVKRADLAMGEKGGA